MGVSGANRTAPTRHDDYCPDQSYSAGTPFLHNALLVLEQSAIRAVASSLTRRRVVRVAGECDSDGASFVSSFRALRQRDDETKARRVVAHVPAKRLRIFVRSLATPHPDRVENYSASRQSARRLVTPDSRKRADRVMRGLFRAGCGIAAGCFGSRCHRVHRFDRMKSIR